jgi:hypothetical protein
MRRNRSPAYRISSLNFRHNGDKIVEILKIKMSDDRKNESIDSGIFNFEQCNIRLITSMEKEVYKYIKMGMTYKLSFLDPFDQIIYIFINTPESHLI